MHPVTAPISSEVAFPEPSVLPRGILLFKTLGREEQSICHFGDVPDTACRDSDVCSQRDERLSQTDLDSSLRLQEFNMKPRKTDIDCEHRLTPAESVLRNG